MDLAAGDDEPADSEGCGAVELMAGEHDGGPTRRGVDDQVVDEVTAVGVEAGVGFVEQPQFGPAGDERCQRGPAPLASGEAADRDAAQAVVEAETRERRLRFRGLETGGTHGEPDVLLDRQIVVQEPGMAEEAHPPAHLTTLLREVATEHLSAPFGQRMQASAGTQKRALARPVRTREMHDLPALDQEVCSGECGEASEEDDGAREADGGHGTAVKTTGGLGVVTRQPGGVGLSSPVVDWRRVVAGIGRTCIASGVLILLFVAYQLWGTGLSEARAQDRLRADFLDALQTPVTTTTTTAPGDDGSSDATAPPAAAPRATPTGEAVAIIRIPKIDVEKAVVEGVSVGALKKGPGHYPSTPLPGQPGNAAIAGHRTTYGAPFYRLDELQPGDRIEVTTKQGDFVYRVMETKIVRPSQNEVLAPTDDNRLTLTTCHPRFSAAQRMIVTASLTNEPVEATPPPVTVPEEPTDEEPGDEPGAEEPAEDPTVVPSLADDASVSGESVSKWPAIAWGSLAAFIWLVTWLLSKRWGRVPAYAMGVPVFLVVLFVFFENFARLLPANV